MRPSNRLERPKRPTSASGNSSHPIKSHGSNETSKIRVVIRIRPIIPKERKRRDFKVICEPIPTGVDRYDQLRVWDPVYIEIAQQNESYADNSGNITSWYKNYQFDRCLWSHCEEYQQLCNDNHYNIPFATQQDVFEDVGKPVLNWILQGFNCSVVSNFLFSFAYNPHFLSDNVFLIYYRLHMVSQVVGNHIQ